MTGKHGFIEGSLEEIEEVLERAEVGRIAICDSLMPYIVPLNFLYYEAKIVFHCSWKGKKLEIVAKNPHCCFEVDEFMEEVSYHYDSKCHLNFDSVLAFGKACIENNKEEKDRFFQLLHAKYNKIYQNQYLKMGNASTRIICLKLLM